jgi:hypothetical protein
MNDSGVVLPGTIALFKEAWALCKERWKTLWGIAAITVFTPYLVGFIVGFIIGLSHATFNANSLITPLFIIPLTLVNLIVYTWSSGAFFFAVRKEEKLTVGQSYKKAAEKFFSLLWVEILVFFITIGSLFLFIIPGIIFGIWFVFSMVIVINEDGKGFGAMFRSREYIRGKIGAVFGRYFLFGVLVALCVYVPITIITTVLVYTLAPAVVNISPLALEQMTRPYVSSLISLLVLPVSYAFIYVLYVHVKNTYSGTMPTVGTGKKIFFLLLGLVGWIIGIILVIAAFTALMYALSKAKSNMYYNQIPTTTIYETGTTTPTLPQ